MSDENLVAQLNRYKFNPTEDGHDKSEIQDSTLLTRDFAAAESARKSCSQLGSNLGQLRNSVAGTSLSCVPSSQFMYYVTRVKSEPKELESATTPASQRNICGMRPKIFYLLFTSAIFVMIAAIVGAVVGTLHHNKAKSPMLDAMEKLSSTMVPMFPVPTFTPYSLNTGPWEIKEPIDVEKGICGQNPQAIDNCNNPYELKFNILKDSKGYMVETDEGVLNGAYLYPPSSPTGMYSFNITDWEFEAYFEVPGAPAKCNTTADAFFLLGENYKFHLIFHYRLPRSCKKWNGYTAPAGQYCHCEWRGYVFKDLKPKATTTTNAFLQTLDSTGSSSTSTVKLISTKTQVVYVPLPMSTGTVESSPTIQVPSSTENILHSTSDYLTKNSSISIT